MRVESLTGRLEFNERRARALEGVVVYKLAGRDEAEDPPQGRISDSHRHPARRHPGLSPRRPPASSAAGSGAAAKGPDSGAGGAGGGAGAAAAGSRPQSWAGRRCPQRPRRTPRRREMRPGSSRRRPPENIERAIPSESSPGPETMDEPGPRRSSEARRRRSALRPGDQRRRRTARPLHRRASRPPRGSRGADHVRHRLRDVAKRTASRRRNGSTACRSADFRVRHERETARSSAGAPSVVFNKPHSIADELELARRRRAGEPGARRLSSSDTLRSTTISSSSAIATTTRTTGSGPRLSARCWSRRPNATRRSGSRSSGRSSAASGPHVQLARRAGDDQAVAGNHAGALGRRRHRLGSAGQPAAGPVPPEVRHPRAVRDLCRPHRREQGMQGAVRVLQAYVRDESPGGSRWSSSATRCCRFRSTRASGTSGSSTTATSSTRWRRPSC